MKFFFLEKIEKFLELKCLNVYLEEFTGKIGLIDDQKIALRYSWPSFPGYFVSSCRTKTSNTAYKVRE